MNKLTSYIVGGFVLLFLVATGIYIYLNFSNTVVNEDGSDQNKTTSTSLTVGEGLTKDSNFSVKKMGSDRYFYVGNITSDPYMDNERFLNLEIENNGGAVHFKLMGLDGPEGLPVVSLNKMKSIRDISSVIDSQLVDLASIGNTYFKEKSLIGVQFLNGPDESTMSNFYDSLLNNTNTCSIACRGQVSTLKETIVNDIGLVGRLNSDERLESENVIYAIVTQLYYE